jgi:hypothetical protein
LEEFSRDNRAEYEKVLGFLEVETASVPTFRTVNRNKYARNRVLRDALKRPPGSLRVAAKLLPRGLRTAVRDKLVSFNRVESERPPIDTQLKKRLLTEIEPGIDQLNGLLGLDTRKIWGI